jgi:hypothetical protein
MAASLFGPTPAELIMAQQKEAQQMQMLRNQQMAQQGQQFGVFAPLYQAGLKLGDVGAQAAMQGLFPQQADPRLQQATAVQSVLAKYADEDQSDPAVLTKIGKDLMSVAPEAGLRAITLASQLTKKTETPFGKINPKDFTPESIREFNRTRDYAVLEPRKEEKPAEQRLRETRIDDLVKNRGISRELAIDIVDRNIEIVPNPVTGVIQRIDKVSGTVTETPFSNLSPQDQGLLIAAAEEADEQTLWQAAEDGTGLWSAVRRGASIVGGQVGLPQSEKVEQARQTLLTATNELARSLVNNPRFAVAEVERVIKEAGTQPSVADTPTLMRARLKVLDTFLRNRLKTAEADAANMNLPQDLRSAQASNAAAIRSFIPKLGVPGSGEKPPRGITQEQWNAMTEDQRARFR